MYTVYQLLAADDKVPRGIFLLLYREDTARETYMAPKQNANSTGRMRTLSFRLHSSCRRG